MIGDAVRGIFAHTLLRPQCPHSQPGQNGSEASRQPVLRELQPGCDRCIRQATQRLPSPAHRERGWG